MSKFLYIIIPLVFLTLLACDDDIATSQVPSIVQNTFKSNFPTARDVEWETAKDHYQVSFEVEHVDHHALLDGSGNLLKYRYDIEETELPEIIKSYLAANFPKKKWEDTEYVLEGSSKYYQLEIDGFWNDNKVVIDSTGSPIENIKYWD